MWFLDVAVGSMKLKEQSEFVVSPEVAFGELGCPPRIPPNAHLLLKIELLEWVDSCASEDFARIPFSERKQFPFERVLEAAKAEKRRGTFYYEKQQYHAVNGLILEKYYDLIVYGFAGG